MEKERRMCVYVHVQASVALCMQARHRLYLGDLEVDGALHVWKSERDGCSFLKSIMVAQLESRGQWSGREFLPHKLFKAYIATMYTYACIQ